MRLLVVDDQPNVVSRILSNIDFKRLGIDDVDSANGADEALALIGERVFDILLTDIEMPKMSGLELIREAKKIQPALLCILLTSHALFSYAKESLKLGCFDYIVQPAPYEVISDSLANAVNTLRLARESQIERGYGRLFLSYEQDFVNSAILKLYSKNEKDRKDALVALRDCGYHIDEGSASQLLFINLFANPGNAAAYPSQNYVLAAISSALSQLQSEEKEEASQGGAFAEYLISSQPHRQYSVLAVWNKPDGALFRFSGLENFYHALCNNIHALPVACYVSDLFELSKLRDVADKILESMRENITKQAGLFVLGEGKDYLELPTSLSSYQVRWENLLKSGQHSLLKQDILDFISSRVLDAPNRYQKLCELHQSLIQMFFHYFYEVGIEIPSLFSQEYTYQDCLGAYDTVENLERMLDFLIGSLDAPAGAGQPLDYIEKAKSYIMDHVNSPLTVKDVADYVHLNPEYFTRMFKKKTGSGIKEYIIRCKLDLAKDLLANSSLPVYMISMELGYSNFSYFVQLFKQEENMTPLEYRERNRKG